ncbi:apaG [Symbiodinium microadriaticum]|nr:apaG [Symbiodinium microadriaticum]
MTQESDIHGVAGEGLYEALTRDIRVTVIPEYLDDESEPEEDHYVWAYTVAIENHGPDTVKLLTRSWQITDAMGRSHEVKGAGVVGEQPVLGPGDRFEYTSGAPLSTPSGIMHGSYQMEGVAGDMFDVAIPAFSLDSPWQAISLH